MSDNAIQHIASVFPIQADALQPPGGWQRRRSIVQEFSANTSTHGIPGISRSQNHINRAFWTIALLVVLGVMVFFIIQSMVNFFGYPTQTTVSIVVERSQAFPAISICNFSPIRRDRFMKPFFNFTNSRNYTNTTDTSTITFTQAIFIREFFRDLFNRQVSVDEYLYNLSTILMACEYNGQTCTATDFIPFLSSSHGYCYTFNAQMKSMNRSVRLLTEDGGIGLLRLRFYAHSHQYVPFVALDAGAGIVAMVHNNTALPLIDVGGISLGPGKRHKLTFKKRTHDLLPAPYTKCTETIPAVMAAMFNRYQGADYRYSQVICTELCVQNYIYQDCGCVDPTQWTARSVLKPGTDEVIVAPLCQELNRCYGMASARIRNNASVWDQFCSHCTQACSSVDVIVTPSSIAAPLGDHYIKETKSFVEKSEVELPGNWSENWMSEIPKNYVSVDILPETTRVEMYTQSASMTPVDLLSNVGGQTGLWLGLSFLSLMEIVEMTYRLLRYQIYLIRRKFQQQVIYVNQRSSTLF